MNLRQRVRMKSTAEGIGAATASESSAVINSGRGEPTSGIILVDKPSGVTSHDVVAAVRSSLGMRRVGHAGTLDPMATGLLVVGFGQATRLLTVIVGHDKTYRATMRLGLGTTTDDADGDLLPMRPGAAQRVDELTVQGLQGLIDRCFTGWIDQVPDAFSAIKVKGRRAYDLARAGQEVRLEPRRIRIASFRLLDLRRVVLPDEDIRVVDADVEVTCSSGTYIRALARDLGDQLDLGGHLTALRRIRVGPFDLENPDPASMVLGGQVVPHTYRNRQGQAVVRNRMVPDCDRQGLLDGSLNLVQAARKTMPVMNLDADQAARVANGGFLDLPVGRPTAALVGPAGKQRLAAILVPGPRGGAKPDVVFHPEG
ncbi:tRNA pseudouridine(55) synthase TruB [Bifidobacterium apicola]|uniref:tRNA pseudouridine(55) synthase TruB n=1 Tax=Bifidobacterium apicola TaxID=3230739 RepID=UPI0036F1CF3A